jgi:hypothetical protein
LNPKGVTAKNDRRKGFPAGTNCDPKNRTGKLSLMESVVKLLRDFEYFSLPLRLCASGEKQSHAKAQRRKETQRKKQGVK